MGTGDKPSGRVPRRRLVRDTGRLFRPYRWAVALIGSGAAGNRTNYVNQMAVAETAIQMRGMGAEFETGGVQINVVPKEGGNNE